MRFGSRHRTLPAVILCSLLAAPPGVSIGLAQDSKLPAQDGPAHAPAAPATAVVGITVPHATVTLAALQRSRIVALTVREGDALQDGQLAVSLDDGVQKIKTESAQVRAESSLDVDLARCRQAQAQRDLERLQAIPDSSSPKELSDAQAVLEVAALSLEIARFEHAEAQRRYAQERLLLEELHLRAPFDSYVSEIFKDPGAAVDEGEGILTLVDLDPLDVTVDCPLELAHQVQAGDSVLVKPLDARWTPRPGRVAFASRLADPASQTFRVIVLVDNPEGQWMSGLKVHVDFTPAQVAAGPPAPGVSPTGGPDADPAPCPRGVRQP